MTIEDRRAAISETIATTAAEITHARGAGRISDAASRLAHAALGVARRNVAAGRLDQAEYSTRIAAAALGGGS